MRKHTVLLDICTVRHALSGSLCPDVQCRRTDAGRRDCGSKKCHNGLLANGWGPLFDGDVDMVADGVFPTGDERNTALESLALVLAEAKAGAVHVASVRYGAQELARQLHHDFDTVVEVSETMTTLRQVTAISHGPTVTEESARTFTTWFTANLSSEDYHFLFEELQRNGKPRIDFEDAMFVGAMLAVEGPVTLVTDDAGFVAANLRLAALFEGLYVVDTATYADPAAYQRQVARMAAVNAAAANGQLAALA